MITFILGPTGCGKTSAIEALARLTGYGVETDSGSVSKTETDLVGIILPTKVIDGVITRAFRRACLGETVIIFLDEFYRNNVRVQDVLMKALLPVSEFMMRKQGFDVEGDHYIIDSPIFGQVMAPCKHIKWVLGANPWGFEPDNAFARRVDPVYVTYSPSILKCFDSSVIDKIEAIWSANVEGALGLPIEYSQLAAATSSSDPKMFDRWLNKVRILGQEQFEIACALIGQEPTTTDKRKQL